MMLKLIKSAIQRTIWKNKAEKGIILFDEFAKLMTDAAGAAQGVAKEAETALQSQFERFLNKWHF